MGFAFYPCGCSVTSDMFNGQIISVSHCLEHWHLLSEDKTLKQMAYEIREEAAKWTAPVKKEGNNALSNLYAS